MNKVCGIYKLFDRKDIHVSQRVQATLLQVIYDENLGGDHTCTRSVVLTPNLD